MLLHQDGSTHERVPGAVWDLIVTMDDATNEHYSMFFCEEEGTVSSFRGVAETVRAKGLFCSLCTDRGSHYWHTPEAGGKVDKANPTQFGRAMARLGVKMVPAYSPEAGSGSLLVGQLCDCQKQAINVRSCRRILGRSPIESLRNSSDWVVMANIEISEELARVVAEARQRFSEFRAKKLELDQDALDLLFYQGRSINGWRNQPVTREQIERLYELCRMGATSVNTSPARFVFVTSDEGKERIKTALMPNNYEKVLTAPLVVIVAMEMEFYKSFDKLFPHAAEFGTAYFTSDAQIAQDTAFRNSTLQGAYLMLAARAIGLDCGPMSGFDDDGLDQEFFAGTTIKSNFLCGIGHGDPESIFHRLPRLDFDEACQLA